ncbi:MAG: YabP/YqfC family sporulation protein [Lachnospiraceae bacterium]|nr:YabP/YqfC family sporulation protein [Lachnospiraceae bacterium]
MAKYKVRRKMPEEKKDLYLQVKRTEKKEKKEYASFFERLTDSVSLTGDVAGEMMLYLAGRHCMIVRNFSSVTEYTACRIRLKTKKYELCIEGTCLRLEYFLPEELRIVGIIDGVSYQGNKG